MKNSIGEKIRKYRKRAGMSQLDLEIAIKTSNGVVSRIENNTVNPNKETLVKIANVLKLNDLEIINLFGIDFETPMKIIEFIEKINSSKTFDEILYNSMKEVALQFDYSIAGLFMLEDKNLFSKYVYLNKVPEPLIKVLGPTYNRFMVNSARYPDNYCLLCAQEKKVYVSENFYEFGKGSLGKRQLQIIARLLRFKMGLGIPIYYKNNAIGGFFVARTNTDNYTYELPILEGLGRQLGFMIHNWSKLEKLQYEK